MNEDSTKYKAAGKYMRISPQKCRLVTDLIKDRFVGEALTILQYSRKKKPSKIVEKVLRSAVANAQQMDPNVDVDNLFITETFVNEGPMWKRFRAAPQGRAARILKRTSHVHIILEEKKGR